MKIIPFFSQSRHAIEENIGGQFNGEPTSANPSNHESDCTDEEPGSALHHQRFIKRASHLSLVFLVLVFSVFREVKHTRELFTISQMVTAADTQRRQWQEVARLDEAREACLMAEVIRLQTLPRETMLAGIAGNMSAPRR